MYYLIIFISFIPAIHAVMGFLKIFKAKFMINSMSQLQTGPLIANIRLVGIIEVLVTLVYLYPPTMHIGFFLLLSWLGGALALHIASKAKPIPLIFIIILWVSAYLRDPSLFAFISSTSKTP